MHEFRDNMRGILAMLACCLFFVLNDAMVKSVGDALPLGQIIALRGVASTLLVMTIAWRMGLLFHLHRHLSPRVGLRTVGEVGATFLFITGLMHLPIANISSIAQAAPLVITAASAMFLGETVGWRRWTAILVGFVGIMIIVRPGTAGFNAYAFFALGSVLLVSLRDVVTRTIPASTPTLAIATITSTALMLSGFAYGLTETWRPVGLRELALLVGAAVSLTLGFVGAIIAMRHGDVSIVAPFRYSFIPYAIVVGWLVWGDVPDLVTLAGITVVVGAGAYTFYRERRVLLARVAAGAGAVAPKAGPAAAAVARSDAPR